MIIRKYGHKFCKTFRKILQLREHYKKHLFFGHMNLWIWFQLLYTVSGIYVHTKKYAMNIHDITMSQNKRNIRAHYSYYINYL